MIGSIWRLNTIFRHADRGDNCLEQFITTHIHELGMGPVRQLSRLSGGNMNYVFRADFMDGRSLIVKHAADEAKVTHLPPKLRHMASNRLEVEARALDILAELSLPDIEIPRVVAFDPVDAVLIMTEVCPGGQLLENAFQQGVFNEKWAYISGCYLYQTHHDTRGVAALRVDSEYGSCSLGGNVGPSHH